MLIPLADLRGRWSNERAIEDTLRRYDPALRIYRQDAIPARRRTIWQRPTFKERWQVCRIGDYRPLILHEVPGGERIVYLRRALHVVLTVEDHGEYRDLDDETVAQIVRMDNWARWGRGQKAAKAADRSMAEAATHATARREQEDEDLFVEIAKDNAHELTDAAEDHHRMAHSTHAN